MPVTDIYSTSSYSSYSDGPDSSTGDAIRYQGHRRTRQKNATFCQAPTEVTAATGYTAKTGTTIPQRYETDQTPLPKKGEKNNVRGNSSEHPYASRFSRTSKQEYKPSVVQSGWDDQTSGWLRAAHDPWNGGPSAPGMAEERPYPPPVLFNSGPDTYNPFQRRTQDPRILAAAAQSYPYGPGVPPPGYPPPAPYSHPGQSGYASAGHYAYPSHPFYPYGHPPQVQTHPTAATILMPPPDSALRKTLQKLEAYTVTYDSFDADSSANGEEDSDDRRRSTSPKKRNTSPNSILPTVVASKQHFSEADIEVLVNKLNRTKRVTEKILDYDPSEWAVMTDLVSQKEEAEEDARFEWLIDQLDTSKIRTRRKADNAKSSVLLCLKRAPKPEVDLDELVRERFSNKYPPATEMPPREPNRQGAGEQRPKQQAAKDNVRKDTNDGWDSLYASDRDLKFKTLPERADTINSEQNPVRNRFGSRPSEARPPVQQVKPPQDKDDLSTAFTTASENSSNSTDLDDAWDPVFVSDLDHEFDPHYAARPRASRHRNRRSSQLVFLQNNQPELYSSFPDGSLNAHDPPNHNGYQSTAQRALGKQAPAANKTKKGDRPSHDLSSSRDKTGAADSQSEKNGNQARSQAAKARNGMKEEPIRERVDYADLEAAAKAYQNATANARPETEFEKLQRQGTTTTKPLMPVEYAETLSNKEAARKVEAAEEAASIEAAKPEKKVIHAPDMPTAAVRDIQGKEKVVWEEEEAILKGKRTRDAAGAAAKARDASEAQRFVEVAEDDDWAGFAPANSNKSKRKGAMVEKEPEQESVGIAPEVERKIAAQKEDVAKLWKGIEDIKANGVEQLSKMADLQNFLNGLRAREQKAKDDAERDAEITNHTAEEAAKADAKSKKETEKEIAQAEAKIEAELALSAKAKFEADYWAQRAAHGEDATPEKAAKKGAKKTWESAGEKEDDGAVDDERADANCKSAWHTTSKTKRKKSVVLSPAPAVDESKEEKSISGARSSGKSPVIGDHVDYISGRDPRPYLNSNLRHRTTTGVRTRAARDIELGNISPLHVPTICAGPTQLGNIQDQPQDLNPTRDIQHAQGDDNRGPPGNPNDDAVTQHRRKPVGYGISLSYAFAGIGFIAACLQSIAVYKCHKEAQDPSYMLPTTDDTNFFEILSNACWLAVGLLFSFQLTLKHGSEHRDYARWVWVWCFTALSLASCFVSVSLYLVSTALCQGISGAGSALQMLVYFLTIRILEKGEIETSLDEFRRLDDDLYRHELWCRHRREELHREIMDLVQQRDKILTVKESDDVTSQDNRSSYRDRDSAIGSSVAGDPKSLEDEEDVTAAAVGIEYLHP